MIEAFLTKFMASKCVANSSYIYIYIYIYIYDEYIYIYIYIYDEFPTHLHMP